MIIDERIVVVERLDPTDDDVRAAIVILNYSSTFLIYSYGRRRSLRGVAESLKWWV